MVAAGMDAVTEDRSGSSAITMVPVVPPNVPRTLLTTRWRAIAATSVCAGSIANVPGAGMVTPSNGRVSRAGAVMS